MVVATGQFAFIHMPSRNGNLYAFSIFLPTMQTRPPCERVCIRYDMGHNSINFHFHRLQKEPLDFRENTC